MARACGRDGYFDPASEIRRVFGAPVVHVLAPGPAIYFQCAHPLVAASVVAHMEYDSDHWARWLRIFRASYLIVFGSRTEAAAVLGRVRELHRGVRGTAPGGARYAADDPELLVWVAASLFEATSKLYSRYVRRLSLRDRERLWEDVAVVAQLFGAGEEVPATLADYRLWLHERLTGPDVTVTAEARAIVKAVFGSVPLQLRPLAHANRLAAAGLLPAQLREEYGLAWSPAHAVALAGWVASLRVLAAPLSVAAGRWPQPSAARA